MTPTHPTPARAHRQGDQPRDATASARAGAVGALLATASFVFGIALAVTSLADYTAADLTPASAVRFLVANESILFVWYAVIYLVFGIAIVPLVRALQQRVRGSQPELAAHASVFGHVWIGLMFATGMILTIGLGAIADLAGDAEQAQALWTAIDTVGNALGGGNELVGGLWILLVSVAAQRGRTMPAWLNLLGAVTAVAGIVTVVPALTEVGMVFGLGCIVWFAAVGRELLVHPTPRTVAR
ncbi:DUF4386 family protein [Euzebya tangerina]|uniref:DUF4386 family protein n=1 Tax=Euzebya tangerina TaxID=591198 RepID=UPI000E316C09|nr:DUF4386 family protein [Euzebya tangerina]